MYICKGGILLMYTCYNPEVRNKGEIKTKIKEL